MPVRPGVKATRLMHKCIAHIGGRRYTARLACQQRVIRADGTRSRDKRNIFQIA